MGEKHTESVWAERIKGVGTWIHYLTYLLQSNQVCTPWEKNRHPLWMLTWLLHLSQRWSPLILIKPFVLSCVVSTMSLMRAFCQPLLWKYVPVGKYRTPIPYPLLKNWFSSGRHPLRGGMHHIWKGDFLDASNNVEVNLFKRCIWDCFRQWSVGQKRNPDAWVLLFPSCKSRLSFSPMLNLR